MAGGAARRGLVAALGACRVWALPAWGGRGLAGLGAAGAGLGGGAFPAQPQRRLSSR